MTTSVKRLWEWEVLDPAYGGVSEGPAWDGSGLLFTRIGQSKIMRYDPSTGTVRTFRDNTNCANGLTFDSAGNLYGAEGGATADARRVVRYHYPDGVGFDVLADGFEGRRLNIPNDIVVDPRGRIWFTDPFYEGAAGPWSVDRSQMDLPHESVYRLDAVHRASSGGASSFSIHRATFDTTRPNGLLFSLDFRVLYVAQSGREPTEYRQLRAYPVAEDGSLGPCTVLHDFGAHRGIDGMRLDTQGNIVAAAGWELGGPGALIYVFSPSGQVLETHSVPCRRPTNVEFGEGGDLYVTTIEGFLLRTATDREGRRVTVGGCVA